MTDGTPILSTCTGGYQFYITTQEQIIKSYFHHLILVLTEPKERVPERVLEANNMELQKSTPAVEEEHNISLKDSSKKINQKSIYSIVTTRKYSVDTTQAVQ